MNTLRISTAIRAFRREQRMSQTVFGEYFGVTAQAVSKWENDASCPDISLLPQLCRLLGITTDELLTGKANEVKLLTPSERKSLDELTLRVYVTSVDGDRIKVNIPMSLVKVCMELGIEVSDMGNKESMKNIDFEKILSLVERGAIGKLVEVESSDGDLVEVVVE